MSVPRGARARVVQAVAAAGLVGAVGCGAPVPQAGPPIPRPDAGSIVTTVALLGDAGGARSDDRVLAALSDVLGAAPDRSIAVFLGDNVYPSGMPDEGRPDRARAEQRLAAQVQAVLRAGARGVFVPGNHDWARGKPAGWTTIRREQAYLTEIGGADVVLLPGDGCPGPAVLDVGDRVRLVALDTHWWLHGHDKPYGPGTTCGAATEAGVLAALRSALAADGRHVLVVAHHPLASGGRHGGRFGVLDHLFPLRHVRPWLWIPLPVLGSAYPLARQAGISRQDLTSGSYQGMRDSLLAALREDPPLLVAGGHDHNLQVLELPGGIRVLVSGGGYDGHTTPVGAVPGTRYAARRSGLMRIDILRDGRVRLGVLVVSEDGAVREDYADWLVTGASGRVP